MRNLKRFASLFFAALPMMAGTSGTVTIVYSPITGTPTLSETALIALALLLPVLAFRSLRSMHGGRGIAALMVAGGLLALEAVTGYHLLPTVEAGSGIPLSNPAGGTTSNVTVSVDIPQTVSNTSGVTLLLRSVTWTNLGFGAQPITGSGYCATGQTLANSATCTVAISGSVPN